MNIKLTWIHSNQRSIKLPFRSNFSFWEGHEENEEADIPEGCQAAVVDGVEDGDLEPGERCSGEECPVVRVIEEVSEGLQASPVPAGGLDGHGSQQVFLTVLLAHLDLACVSAYELLTKL